MSPRSGAKPFSPSKEPADALDARTVGRDDVLRLIAGKIASVATSGNRPHTLLIGPRGAGKTHLLEVALHRAQRDLPDFEERVAVVRLDEDLVGVPRLIDLQREVLKALGVGRAEPGAYLPAVITEALGQRVLLLVIENLDRLFASFREAGQQDFRGWVETSRQIMVLATSPLLFPGVTDRSLPWWGNLSVVHLDPLTLDAGRALLIHRANQDGDADLADLLRSDRGLARLKAVDALTGGSPRIWMILADVITVELLDELVPAVEALLEALVPYYQQLLWDLSPVEQLAVRALAEGSRQAMSVSELAVETDTDQRSLSTILGRLVESKWLRAEKPDGLDKRLTFYRLREPMLRHHLQYRSSADQPLPLIVEILRAWFDREELAERLLVAPAGSGHERLLARSFDHVPHPFDDAYRAHDVDRLLASARSWIHGGDANIRTPHTGELVEWAVQNASRGSGSTVEERVGGLLDEAARSAPDRSGTALTLVAAGWNEAFRTAPENLRRLDDLAATVDLARADDLLLELTGLHAQFAAAAQSVHTACAVFRDLADLYEERGDTFVRERAHAELAGTPWAVRAGEAARALHRLDRLEFATRFRLDSSTVSAISRLEGVALVGFVENVARGFEEPVDPGTDRTGFLENLRGAVRGDARRRAQLPTEIVTLVDDVISASNRGR